MPEEDFKGIYKPNQYKDVMLPLIVLRRLDLVLEPTKNKVLNKAKALKGTKLKDQGMDSILNRTAKQQFHNKSEFTFEKLKADPDNISANLTHYINGFSEKVRTIMDHFKFEDQIAKLEKHNLLYKIIVQFCEINLHPDKVSKVQMRNILTSAFWCRC